MFFICTVEKRSQRVHDRNELGLEILSLGVVNMNVTTLGERRGLFAFFGGCQIHVTS